MQQELTRSTPQRERLCCAREASFPVPPNAASTQECACAFFLWVQSPCLPRKYIPGADSIHRLSSTAHLFLATTIQTKGHKCKCNMRISLIFKCDVAVMLMSLMSRCPDTLLCHAPFGFLRTPAVPFPWRGCQHCAALFLPSPLCCSVSSPAATVLRPHYTSPTSASTLPSASLCTHVRRIRYESNGTLLRRDTRNKARGLWTIDWSVLPIARYKSRRRFAGEWHCTPLLSASTSSLPSSLRAYTRHTQTQ